MPEGSTLDTFKLRILHISDLHERGPREHPWRRRRVLGKEWEQHHVLRRALRRRVSTLRLHRPASQR